MNGGGSRRSERWQGWLFMGPALLFVVIFVLIPLCQLVATSLTDRSLLGGGHFIGLQNYARLWRDSAFWQALKFTIQYTLVLTPVALAPSLLGVVGWLYGGVALALSFAFVGHAVAVWRTADDQTGHPSARRMFRFSLLYLSVLFAALPLDRVVAWILVG